MAVSAKRDDSDRIDVSRSDLTPTVSQVLRAVDEAAKSAYAPPPATDDHKMSVFWRVFGATILSIVALVVITLFNNVTTSLGDLRAEVLKANEARAAAVNDLRAEIARGADARADLIRKDEFNSRLTTQWTSVQNLQSQNNSQNATLTSLRTEIDGLKERLTRQTADADAVRKEHAAVAEAIKKDVAALELLKERLTAVAADAAASREAVQKLREEANRNQAADQERKERRDALQKQTEDTLKDLARGVQDLREKLARLEGLTAPPPTPANPPPPTPKK
jgi:uncharacterized membrane protein YccC